MRLVGEGVWRGGGGFGGRVRGGGGGGWGVEVGEGFGVCRVQGLGFRV